MATAMRYFLIRLISNFMNRFLTRYLMVALFCIAFAIPRLSYAIVATHVSEHPQAVFSIPSESEDFLGRKRSWRAQIGLKILNWKLKKQQVHFKTRLWQPTDSIHCGRIALKDGTVIDAQILAISATEVRYKRCGKPNDPELIELKANILSVVAADGGFLFRNTVSENTKTANPNKSGWDGVVKMEHFSIGSMVNGLLGFIGLFAGLPWLFIASMLGALINAGVGLRRVKDNPERFKPESKIFAYIGIALGSILLILIAIGVAALAAV
jgi:hypothetical protein